MTCPSCKRSNVPGHEASAPICPECRGVSRMIGQGIVALMGQLATAALQRGAAAGFGDIASDDIQIPDFIEKAEGAMPGMRAMLKACSAVGRVVGEDSADPFSPGAVERSKVLKELAGMASAYDPGGLSR